MINQNDVLKFLYSLKSIGNFNFEDMHRVLEQIWNEMDFNQTHDAFDMKIKIDYLLKEFQFTHQSRKDFIYRKMQLVPSHTKKEKKILDKIKKEKLRYGLLHGEDENILFDANEFCRDHPELKLKFVSADQDFIKVINMLMDYLCFENCINLMEFSSN